MKMMNVSVRGKNVEVTEALGRYAEAKVGRLSEWFEPGGSAQVTLSVQNHPHLHVVEITVMQQGMIFRAEEKSKDMYGSLDLAADKLERQARKLKGKMLRKIRSSGGLRAVSSGAAARVVPDDDDPYEVERVKRVQLKPIDLEEAILQLNLLDHDFHLFINRDSGAVGLVYRRSNGTYGLIETGS